MTGVTPSITPDIVRAALKAHTCHDYPALPGRTNHLRAGVVVPILWDPAPQVLLTQRPTTLRHGGELCFPGGKPEVDDADMLATALREGREELGIHEPRVLGRLSSMPIYTSDYRLEPFVVELTHRELCANPAEVERVHRLDLQSAMSRPSVSGIPFTWEGRHAISPLYQVGDRYLFGATAHTFTELVSALCHAVGLSGPELVEGEVTWEEVLASTRPAAPDAL